jgi:hypothetical protein
MKRKTKVISVFSNLTKVNYVGSITYISQITNISRPTIYSLMSRSEVEEYNQYIFYFNTKLEHQKKGRSYIY